jgi:hypothetical protein
MTYIQNVQCEADCGVFGIAKSQQGASLAHTMSDALVMLRRKQNMAVDAIFLSVSHISQRFLLLLEQGFSCIWMLTVVLFRCACIFSCFLDTVFLSFLRQFQSLFFDTVLSIRNNKICICSGIRLSFQHEYKNQKAVWLDYTIYKSSYQISLMREGL